MTTQEVANRFYELIQTGNYPTIYEELYDTNAKSIEAEKSPYGTVQGMEAIHEKGKQFHETLEEMHGGYNGEPIVAGNFFAVAMGFDATFKERGRMQMDEIAVYEVKDGKIISEQFFY